MAAFPVLPQTQALFSATFIPPPLDGSLTLNEIYDWHLENNPEHRLFICARIGALPRVIYWGEAGRAVHRGTQIIKNMTSIAGPSNVDAPPAVAILAVSDTVTYWTLLMSVMKADCIAFPISTRNSPSAVASLMAHVGVRHVLVGPEPAVQKLAKEALEIMRESGSEGDLPSLLPTPRYEDLYVRYAKEEFEAPPPDTRVDKLERVVMYTHSSGSTAHPKTVAWTNRRMLQYAMIPWFSNQDFTDKVFAIHNLPMFHVMGALQIPMNASCGNIIACFEPGTAAAIPTPDTLIQGARSTSSDYIFCLPVFAEAWARNPEHVKWLAQRSGIIYGGGNLNKAAGDHLSASGVRIAQMYGSTESAGINVLVPGGKDVIPQDWEYFTIPKSIEIRTLPQGDNTFELVLISTPWNTLTSTNTVVDGHKAYATADLLEPHPERPGYWKVFGRIDDQIVHSTGEKTNAGPLERILDEDMHVSASMVFGRGRFQAGVLVEPKPEFAFDPLDIVRLAEFRDKIWPTVERMNKIASQHSRIFKEMIIVSSPSKPFVFTLKRTLSRQVMNDLYAEEISALYTSVERTSQATIPPPSIWDMNSTLTFLSCVVDSIVGAGLNIEDDLFENGCDSLQATWIRTTILRALRTSTKLDTREISPSFVYDHPSIAGLSAFMLTLVSGMDADATRSAEVAITEMQAMVEKYTRSLPHVPVLMNGAGAEETHSPSLTGSEVLVTGTTGALGSYLLAELIRDPSVARIYALNRASGTHAALFNRQRQSFLSRGLEESILYSSKVILLPGDVTQPNFGLPTSAYSHLLSSVTHVVHSAWRINMNLSLSSFETHIKGLRCLIDFALSAGHVHAKPKFLFVSSIAVLRNLEMERTAPEALVVAEQATGNGYAESKWVSEHILGEAANRTGLDVSIVRMGQLSGGLNGCWNSNEWFPSMIQTSKDLQCLPEITGTVAWIPLGLAAATLNDIRSSQTDQSSSQGQARVFQVVHPKPTTWTELSSVLTERISVPLVPYDEWLSRLEAAPALPAYQLITMFRELKNVACHAIALRLYHMETSSALSTSRSLNDPSLRPLGEKDVDGWLRFQFGNSA